MKRSGLNFMDSSAFGPRRDGAGSFVLLWFSVLTASLALWKVIDIALWVSEKISITFL